MTLKLSSPLYARDLAPILKVSQETARRKINLVKEKTGLEIISLGDYLRNSKDSPSIFGFEEMEVKQILFD
jgi:DeoR/GlpR family transcriptional regulator of sugar metabolism